MSVSTATSPSHEVRRHAPTCRITSPSLKMVPPSSLRRDHLPTIGQRGETQFWPVLPNTAPEGSSDCKKSLEKISSAPGGVSKAATRLFGSFRFSELPRLLSVSVPLDA